MPRDARLAWPFFGWLVLLVSFAASCAAEEPVPAPVPATPPPFPRTILDAGGTSLRLEARPERIVSISAGATETLFAIGAADRLVAVDQFSDYPEAAKALPRVDYSNPSAEQLIALHPDLVLMTRRHREIVERYRGLGLPILYLGEPADLEGVLRGIQLLGSATGTEDTASAVIASLRNRIEAVRARSAVATIRPRTYYELTPQLHSVGGRSFVGTMLSLAGAQNIAPADSTFPQLAAEAVLAADPEVIILAQVGAKTTPTSVAQRPGWDAVSAVRDNRVYSIDSDAANRAGPRVVDALEEMERLLATARAEPRRP